MERALAVGQAKAKSNAIKECFVPGLYVFMGEFFVVPLTPDDNC